MSEPAPYFGDVLVVEDGNIEDMAGLIKHYEANMYYDNIVWAAVAVKTKRGYINAYLVYETEVESNQIEQHVRMETMKEFKKVHKTDTVIKMNILFLVYNKEKETDPAEE